jgi:hypothetical protein
MSEELARCINPKPVGPDDFGQGQYQINIKLPGSSATFLPPRVFYLPGSQHIW